ncbi:uncharacterized protein LOC116300345 isoform X2 [Actinia tenebrosa]|nr:uncharacterized protein LOC116300345 isoform X2 [Actinia tenebrosa]
MASKLDLRYKVISNLAYKGEKYTAKVNLTNKGQLPIKKSDWTIYFCSIRLVIPQTGSPPVKFEHINGCLHKLQPTAKFPDLLPGNSFDIDVTAKHWVAARTDVMPNWYVSAPGLKPKVITSTVGESLDFVEPFLTKEQWKRFPGDAYDPYTAKKRYDEVGIDVINSQDIPLIVPQPLSMTGLDKDKRMTIDSEWKIYADSKLTTEAKVLADKFSMTVVTSAPSPSTKVLRVAIGNITIAGSHSNSLEAYTLDIKVSTQMINIVGRSAAGVFYGIQSLLAITDDNDSVPEVFIQDSPRYSYRGMHLDVGRNFMPKSAVFRLLDAMATYKMNKFHFHLSDDEGWRLEIPGLPELTQIGSKRCYDPTGLKCIQTDLGSGPDEPTSPNYYSVGEYKEILQYASDRHIQVIPEFDMPGHGYAAIKSMEGRFKKKNSTNPSEAQKYLLTEADDPSEYLSVQYFKDDAINPCLESTYTFVEHIIKEVVLMHTNKQPLTIYHFGGDEVAHGAWTKSSACKNLAQQRGLNFSASDIVDQLKDYFVQRVATITKAKGLNLAGWEDGLLGKGDVPYNRSFITTPEVYAYAWNNIWEWGGGKRAYQLANAGYKVVMTQATHLYFDHPYEPDPEERGYYWATRFTDVRKTFGFMPDDLFANVENKRNGEPLTREELCKDPNMCVDLKNTENIVGMAGALWTETVRTADQMDSMIYPRLLAIAERAWHKASWEGMSDRNERNKKRTENWKQFANLLGQKEMARLDKMGVKYYVPPPGASLDGNKIRVRTSLPGLKIKYSDDDGKIWQDVTDKTLIHRNSKLATWSADGKRMSRIVDIAGQVKANASSLSVNTGVMLLGILKLVYKLVY